MFHVRSYAETGSTNDDAAALLGTPSGAGVVLLADYQRAGRGRHARAWVAPAGSSLLFTTLLPQAIASEALWAVTFWTALGVADGIEAATGIRVELQWPNDLLLDGRKCCGILCISRVVGGRAWVGCGTGVNVVRPSTGGGEAGAADAARTAAAADAALPAVGADSARPAADEARPGADMVQSYAETALEAVVPAPAFLSDAVPGVERRPVLDAILAAYERRLPELASPRAVARAWEARAALAGTRYRLLVDGEPEPLDAIARRIGDDGALVVEANGAERHVSLADARVVRA